MLLVLVAAPLAWLLLATKLSAFMARRGYDRVAWLVISVLFGPIALVFALMELTLAVPRQPEIVQKGRPGQGHQDILVVCGEEDLPPDAEYVLDEIAPSRRRLVLTRVLPLDGARAAEWAAEAALRACASTLGTPKAELVLLFGVPSDSIGRYAIAERFDMVLVAEGRPGPGAAFVGKSIQVSDVSEAKDDSIAIAQGRGQKHQYHLASN